MKIAFATEDLVSVDAHFGCARHIVVWEVSAGEARPVAKHSFPEAEADGGHDKLAPRVEALEGCSVVFVAAIGAAASKLAVERGVLPVRLPEGEAIADAAAKLGRLLGGTPPPWLRNAVARDVERPADPEA